MRSLVVLCFLVASIAAFDPTLKIVGGSIAPNGAYPHQISLKWYRFHICGGSIVDEQWVITSAHCVSGLVPNRSLNVFVGSNKILGGDSYEVLEIHSHEDFNGETALNDVAILRVQKIAYSPTVKKIAVEKGEVPEGASLILSGWGSIKLGGSSRNDLRHILLKTISAQQCKDAHADSGRPIEKTQLCTLTKSGEGACHGDWGGPLISDVNGEHKLVGIVSWGRPCARGFPDVFTKVSSYVDWFNEKCNNCL